VRGGERVKINKLQQSPPKRSTQKEGKENPHFLAKEKEEAGQVPRNPWAGGD